MNYFTTVLALARLGLFATVTIARTDLFIIGATAVIAVNVLVNFRVEDRLGFKWLVLTL